MNYPVGPSVQRINEDEIDLLGLFKALLRTWKVCFIALLLVTALFGGYQALKILTISNEVTYGKPIRLTFPDAHRLRFPSGAPFSYGDIISPAVVQLAHQRNKLSDYDVSIAELQGSLAAEPYAPTYPFILERYQKLLSDKRLTVEQIADLQERMKTELEQASAGTVLVSMRLEKSQLPENVASKVLSDIPAIWAERTIRDKGVLDINVRLASSASLNTELIGQVEYMIVSDLLDEKLNLLRQNIKNLTEFEGVATISDPETGMRLLDLGYAIDDLGRYVIDELMSPVRYLGLSRDSKLSVYYYEDRLKKLTMELSLLEDKARLAKQAYDAYQSSQQRSAGGGTEKTSGGSVMVSQLGPDMLSKLVEMSGDSEREAYKQRLNQQWLNLNLEGAEIKNKIDDVGQVLLSLKKVDRSANYQVSTVEQEYLERVKATLPSILVQLAGYFEVTERIYKQLSIESVGVRDLLYTPITNEVLVQKEGLNLKKTLLIWVALMFLTFVIVVPTVMIRNAIKARP